MNSLGRDAVERETGPDGPVSLVPWLFLPGHTIEAAIKAKNNKELSQQELSHLVALFQMKNPNKVPSVGESFLIPVIYS